MWSGGSWLEAFAAPATATPTTQQRPAHADGHEGDPGSMDTLQHQQQQQSDDTLWSFTMAGMSPVEMAGKYDATAASPASIFGSSNATQTAADASPAGLFGSRNATPGAAWASVPQWLAPSPGASIDLSAAKDQGKQAGRVSSVGNGMSPLGSRGGEQRQQELLAEALRQEQQRLQQQQRSQQQQQGEEGECEAGDAGVPYAHRWLAPSPASSLDGSVDSSGLLAPVAAQQLPLGATPASQQLLDQLSSDDVAAADVAAADVADDDVAREGMAAGEQLLRGVDVGVPDVEVFYTPEAAWRGDEGGRAGAAGVTPAREVFYTPGEALSSGKQSGSRTGGVFGGRALLLRAAAAAAGEQLRVNASIYVPVNLCDGACDTTMAA